MFWLERGEDVFKSAYGRRSVYPAEEEMGLDTIFDAASLTKVVATTPSILKLIEMGKLGLDDSVRKFIPELGGDRNKSEITAAASVDAQFGFGGWREAGLRVVRLW